MIGWGGGAATALVVAPRASPAGQQTGHRGDPAADDEARHGGADDHFTLMRAQLRAPIGRLDDLAAQLLDRHRELRAVGLDRLPDLFRGALAHFVSAFAGTVGPVGVAGCGSVRVARISWASSIAICGIGGEPFLKKRAAMKPAMPPNRNRKPDKIR